MMTLITAAKETSWFHKTKNELRELNNFKLNEGQDKRISVYESYFVFVPLFSKPILTKQIILSMKNSQEFLAL